MPLRFVAMNVHSVHVPTDSVPQSRRYHPVGQAARSLQLWHV